MNGNYIKTGRWNLTNQRPRITITTNPYHGVKYYYLREDGIDTLVAVLGTALSQPRLTRAGDAYFGRVQGEPYPITPTEWFNL